MIKTRLQVAKGDVYSKYHPLVPDGGFINCGKAIWKEAGYRGFWVGFKACSMRAVYVGITEFATYEYSLKLFR